MTALHGRRQPGAPGAWAWISFLAGLLLWMAIAQAQGATEESLPRVAQRFLRAEDYLGFRVLVKKAYFKRITSTDSIAIKYLVDANANNAGYDLIDLWNTRGTATQSKLDSGLEAADQLMLAKRFGESFSRYQSWADYLKKTRDYYAKVSEKFPDNANAATMLKELDLLYPYVLESMGRALYGAGRYKDSLEVFGWINPRFPRFRQVLFEKMWAAFRAGRVDIALGAIASQRSAYFSRFLSPEAYLIQVYVYRKLCRKGDLQQVTDEIRKYGALLDSGQLEDWAGMDVATRVLWGLIQQKSGVLSSSLLVTAEDKRKEQGFIAAELRKEFDRARPKIRSDLKSIAAYVNLAGATEAVGELKPVEKITSREALLQSGLEIWPADSAEEWMDEIGKHRFIGESLCDSTSH